MKSNLTDELRINMGGKRPEDIFVIINKDGSTIVKDPGLDRPWHSMNRKYAEHHAKQIGHGCTVVDLPTALKSVMQHPKNLPKHLPKGFKMPDLPT